MNDKVNCKKKLGKAKAPTISSMSLPENIDLTVEKNILPAEMQPSKIKSSIPDSEVLKRITGTENESLATDILVRGYTTHVCEPFCEQYVNVNLALNFMQEMKPQSSLEAMLCSQIISLHCGGMDYLARLKNDNIQCQKDSHLNSAVKLLRLQHETIESLTRLRRNGEQKLIVQHVNVNDGGQAVVNGQLTTGG